MRLLLWVLFVTLVTFFSSCDAASVDANKRLERAVYTKLTSRSLAADNGLNHDKRFLRGESSKIVTLNEGGQGETEERGASRKISAVLREIKGSYLKWEQKILASRFKKMAAKRKTYSDVMEGFRVRMMNSGRWGTPSGFKRYANLYKTWLKNNNHGDLAV
ncbi:hypothetical protein PI124_g19490 [Phytophthora idaei]|nr:hypothetical protein PI125_g20729 [Phytophthora idaei]KAG3133347.1 hypothetical protein PI126_g19216 [Phytophthora idaei]KAG3235474.1 hypothetical protein PI124_g19490 [Phytophthora idaei]